MHFMCHFDECRNGECRGAILDVHAKILVDRDQRLFKGRAICSQNDEKMNCLIEVRRRDG
jgi:hypothetical protein